MSNSQQVLVGDTANFHVYRDPSLGQDGLNLAGKVLGRCEEDYAQISAIFGGLTAGPFTVYINPGATGAYHNLSTDIPNVINCNTGNVYDSNGNRAADFTALPAAAEVVAFFD